MNSLVWRRAVEVLPPLARREAGLMAGRIQGESLRLEVAAPGELAAAVLANGPALLTAVRRVERALEREKAIASVITASAALVALALRLAPRAAPGPAPAQPGAVPKRAVPRAKRRARRTSVRGRSRQVARRR
ncbi:MAG: hypothetical protein JNK67_32580 [Alphaproteobacteria bacterium]|nr:hypothetical protein [Alphaproteobacteria bacterium]